MTFFHTYLYSQTLTSVILKVKKQSESRSTLPYTVPAKQDQETEQPRAKINTYRLNRIMEPLKIKPNISIQSTQKQCNLSCFSCAHTISHINVVFAVYTKCYLTYADGWDIAHLHWRTPLSDIKSSQSQSPQTIELQQTKKLLPQTPQRCTRTTSKHGQVNYLDRYSPMFG